MLNKISITSEISMVGPSVEVIPKPGDELARTGSRLESLSTEILFLILESVGGLVNLSLSCADYSETASLRRPST
jgi:hypothetical protein